MFTPEYSSCHNEGIPALAATTTTAVAIMLGGNLCCVKCSNGTARDGEPELVNPHVCFRLVATTRSSFFVWFVDGTGRDPHEVAVDNNFKLVVSDSIYKSVLYLC